jgi:hypothetical protein
MKAAFFAYRQRERADIGVEGFTPEEVRPSLSSSLYVLTRDTL